MDTENRAAAIEKVAQRYSRYQLAQTVNYI